MRRETKFWPCLYSDLATWLKFMHTSRHFDTKSTCYFGYRVTIGSSTGHVTSHVTCCATYKAILWTWWQGFITCSPHPCSHYALDYLRQSRDQKYHTLSTGNQKYQQLSPCLKSNNQCREHDGLWTARNTRTLGYIQINRAQCMPKVQGKHYSAEELKVTRKKNHGCHNPCATPLTEG